MKSTMVATNRYESSDGRVAIIGPSDCYMLVHGDFYSITREAADAIQRSWRIVATVMSSAPRAQAQDGAR